MDIDWNRQEERSDNPVFRDIALKILDENSRLFVFVRFLSNKDFYHMESEEAFDKFLRERRAGECLTLFREKFVIVQDGILDDRDIQALEIILAKEISVEWVAIGKNKDGTQWSAFVNDMVDFQEIANDEKGREILIIEDQDWFDEAITIHAYVPDSDGIVRKVPY